MPPTPPMGVEHQVPHYLLSEAVERLESAHHLEGWAAEGPDGPVLFFLSTVRIPRDPFFVSYGYLGTFGSTLTVSVGSKNGLPARVCVDPANPAFDGLRKGHFAVAFISESGPHVMDFPAKSRRNFIEQWDQVRTHTPVFPDSRAHYWECLEYQQDIFKDWLDPEDHLSLGWSDRYKRWVMTLHREICSAKASGPLDTRGDALVKAIDDFVEAVNSEQLSVPFLCNTMKHICAEGDETIFSLLLHQAQYMNFCASVNCRAYISILTLALEVFFLSPEVTNEGKRVAWIDYSNDQKVNHTDLQPDKFPTHFHPQDYWFFLPAAVFPRLGACISGSDVPVDLSTPSDLWNLFPVAKDIESTNELAELHIEEAIESKKWTIPN